MATFKFFGTSGAGGGGDTNTNIANDNLTFDGDHNTGLGGNDFTWFDTDIDVDRLIKLVGDGASSKIQIGYTEATNYELPTSRGTSGQTFVTDGSGGMVFKDIFSTSGLADDTNTGLGTECGVDLLATAERNTMMGNGCCEVATAIEDIVAIGNGAMALQLTGIKATAIGSFAMAQAISSETGVAIGYRSAQSITSGVNIVAIGQQSLEDNTADSSTAIGHKAMLQNTSGIQNTAVGFESLRDNTLGQGMTAIGFQSQQLATSTRFNTSIGANSLANLTGALGGNGNTAIGWNTMVNTVSCQRNTCIGERAGSNLGDTALGGGGDSNIMIGATSGLTVTTGSNNIIVGDTADSIAGSSGTIIIGNDEVATGSNELHFGSATNNCTVVEGGTITADKSFNIWLNGTEYKINCIEV